MDEKQITRAAANYQLRFSWLMKKYIKINESMLKIQPEKNNSIGCHNSHMTQKIQ